MLHRRSHSLVGILEVFRDQIGNICSGVLMEHAEEICTRSTLARVLGVVILEECKENLISHALAQFFEEPRTGEIDLIPIRTLPLAIIDGCIHSSCFQKFKVTIAP